MTIPDVNVLVHAYNSDFPGHPAAKRWWEQALNGGRSSVGLSWASILGFLRIATSRVALTKPLPVSGAVGIARSWLGQAAVEVIVPGEGHGEIVFRLLEEIGAAGNLTTDAHLAALALEYRAEIATTDADFARFPGVAWFNPVSGKRGR
ncbi:MAG TPA: TA system VapC family ribonuclease toxin [Bryobacteraceae bacterium]|nr:TA system VapC family ribonuclease toxin [Bryobacteraceae bacterium]